MKDRTLTFPGNPGATAAWAAFEDRTFAAGNVSGGGRVRHSKGPHGTVLRADADMHAWGRLSGSANPYTATPVYPTAGGTWADVPGVATLSACYEAEAVSGLSGKVVKLRPEAGEWRFRYSRGGPSRRSHYGPTHVVLGCPCTEIPDTLDMRVANPPPNGNASLVYPATLHWQVKPADLSTYRSDDPGYYTNESFSSTDGSYHFKYKFGCSQGFYYVSGLILPDSSLGYPGEFAIVQWLVGLPGNTCDPFSLHAGASGNVDYRNQGISIDGA